MGPRLFRRGNYFIVRQHHGFMLDASMGPRLFRRGNRISACPSGRAENSFNGATSFQTWKPVPEWSFQGQKIRFNGATSFQTWKLHYFE